ncbi:MAG: hypothetical protein H7Z41_07515 [Cytophagales bacterium]|nr:hypothetical protein [Armatimonadota bacterium]
MILRPAMSQTINQKPVTASIHRVLVAAALATLTLSSAAYAQTNSSSGVNRRSAAQAAQPPAVNPSAAKATGTAPVVGTVRPAKRATAKTTKPRASASRATAPRPVKITIRGTRQDTQRARQQGAESLRQANVAAAAARDAANNPPVDTTMTTRTDGGYNNFYGYGPNSFLAPGSQLVPNPVYPTSTTVPVTTVSPQDLNAGYGSGLILPYGNYYGGYNNLGGYSSAFTTYRFGF